jgi:putative hydrolase of HD superfamily
MRKKNTNPSWFLPEGVDPLIRLYFQVNHLKQLYRQGWLKKGRDIPPEQCESVAEHIFGMAILALFVCDTHFPELDRNKVVTMTLIHELGEIKDGDKYVTDPEERKARKIAEREAITELLSDFPDSIYLELWEEYERGDTPEARLVKELDKLEMVMQAAIYSRQVGGDMSEFFVSSDPFITSDALRTLFEAVRTM